MAPPSPPPAWMCSSDPHRPRPRLTPAAARSSRPGSPWPPASRRAGPEILWIAIEPTRRRCAPGALVLNSMRSRPAPQPAGLLRQRRRPPRDVCGGQEADGEHDLIRRPPWHRSSHTVLDPGPAGARRAAVISSPGLGVFAVAAAGVLCAFCCVVGTLPEQCLRRRPRANPLVTAVFRTRRLLHERHSATCPRRRRPGQVRRTHGGLQITAGLRGCGAWRVSRHGRA